MNNKFRLNVFITAYMILFSTHLSAQETLRPLLANQFIEVFNLNTASPSTTIKIPVESTNLWFLDVLSDGVPIDIAIIDPLGNPVDERLIETFNLAVDDVPPLGAVLFAPGEHAQLTLQNPASGNWEISLSLQFRFCLSNWFCVKLCYW